MGVEGEIVLAMDYEAYTKQVAYLNELCIAYYENSESLVSDDIYDQLYREVKEFEEQNPAAIRADSPTQRIGSGSPRSL